MTTRAVIDAQASCGVETGFEVEKRLTSMITKREKTLQFVNKISRTSFERKLKFGVIKHLIL